MLGSNACFHGSVLSKDDELRTAFNLFMFGGYWGLLYECEVYRDEDEDSV